MATAVEAVVARAVHTTRTVKAMTASMEDAMVEIKIQAHLLHGYGLSYPSASAAFASVRSSHSSGGHVVSVRETL